MSGNSSRRAFLRRSAATVTAVTTLAAAGPTATAQTAASATEIEAAVHAAVNQRREANGLAPLEYHAGLAADARAYSERMATEDFFSHTGPGESSFTDHYDTSCGSMGENILYRTVREDSEAAQEIGQAIVDQWMNSPGHRDNILGEWESEGVGVYITDSGTLYATQAFGSCSGDATPGVPDEDDGDESDGDDTETPEEPEDPDDGDDGDDPEDTPTPDDPEDTPTPDDPDDDGDDDGDDWGSDDDDEGRDDDYPDKGRGHDQDRDKRGKRPDRGRGRGRTPQWERTDEGYWVKVVPAKIRLYWQWF